MSPPTIDNPDKVLSKDHPPLPTFFLPVFVRNQFQTTIELPTEATFGSLAGQCAIVTGSNTGLGLEASRQLLSLGLSRLVMGIRSLDSGNKAAASLRAAYPRATIDVFHVDMTSYDSVREFAAQCNTQLDRIDIAILNAGVFPASYKRLDFTGHEVTMQVNHVSTALLAMLLVPILRAKRVRGAPPARLTLVNSVMAHLCSFPHRDRRPLLESMDDVDSPDAIPFNGTERYGASKLVNQMFVYRLASYVDPSEVIINMVDPGLTKGTGLGHDGRGAVAKALARQMNNIAGRPLDRGATTFIHAVIRRGAESHGCFLMNCHNAPYSKFYYSEGEALVDTIWKETMEDLKTHARYDGEFK